MARVKISEYKAKHLVYTFLGQSYHGVEILSSDHEPLQSLDRSKRYVIKVDEGVKKRFKQGLMGINKTVEEVKGELKRLQAFGYFHFIVEEYVEYDHSHERYVSIERVRDGYRILYSQKGGVDIEESDEVTEFVISDTKEVEKISGIDSDFLGRLIECFDEFHFSFLEINPLLVQQKTFTIIDLAVEVDSSAKFFIHNGWTSSDFRFGKNRAKTEEEKNIEKLASQSQASFRFTVLNPNGSVWVLLSGGGASIAVADEVHNLGHGRELANYGEYSGNPNTQETYLYTKNLLSLLLKSTSASKSLVIAGGVANFTDVKKTFIGIIQALDEVADTLLQQGVKVYVRRGGPNQKEGLSMITKFLKDNSIYGDVKGPELILTDIVKKLL